MRLLVDTHAIVWATVEPERLSPRARQMFEDTDNELIVSAIAAYEIEFKRPRDAALARLPPDMERALRGLGFAWLSLTPAHAAMAGRLPRLHGDPFDRLLIAQALAEGMAILSADNQISAYGAVVIW